MRIAYADPPYLGCGAKHYAHQHGDAADFDRLETHAELIDKLVDRYPDGWALSLSSPSLWWLLRLCPRDVRVAAWVKPFASFKPGVNPGYAWEPVIWRGGRQKRDRSEPTVRDWVSANITLQKGTSGAKPEAFCRWLFDLLGMTREDEFHDLFPGSGAVTQAHQNWRAEIPLDLQPPPSEPAEIAREYMRAAQEIGGTQCAVTAFLIARAIDGALGMA